MGEPTKAVLLETPKQFRAVDVHIVEPGEWTSVPKPTGRRDGVTSIDRVSRVRDHLPDPVLTAERAHLARAADCLTEMRTAASAVVDAGVDAWASERLGAARAERLRSLAADPGVPPSSAAPTRPTETFHIGRRHVRDAAGDPVVIDWRAPMSRPFYQASAVDPQGLVRRRRFGFAAGELTGYEDELLAAGDEHESRFLREEIERPRSGPMRDIVATIQPDQDDIVRAPLTESICVQGAPGTGKTAVGLHRAAYLLYTHGGQLARSGVLVVGPNRAFLRYIEEVLPTLGEVDVDQTTVAGLTARVPVRAVDRPEVAVLKGDARMAEVLRRALWGEIAKPADSVQVPLAGRRYRVPVERLKRYVDDVRRRGRADDDQQLLHYAAGRERLAMLRRGGRPPAEGGGRRQPDRRRDPQGRPQRRGAGLLRRGLAGPRRGRAACTTCGPTRPAGPGGPRRARRRRAGAAALAARPGRCAPRRGPRPTPSSSTRSPGCWTARPATGTSCSTRRRTSRPCSAARWPAGWPPARSPCSATSPRRPARGRRRTGRQTLAGLGRPDTVVRPLTRGTGCPARCWTSPTGCCR